MNQSSLSSPSARWVLPVKLIAAVGLALGMTACPVPTTTEDAGASPADAGTTVSPDAGSSDAGAPDSGEAAEDGGTHADSGQSQSRTDGGTSDGGTTDGGTQAGTDGGVVANDGGSPTADAGATAGDAGLEDAGGSSNADAGASDAGNGLQAQCFTAADLAALSSDEFDNAYGICRSGCVTANDPASCIASCVVSASGMTTECAFCLAADVQCLLDACLQVCTFGSPAECDTCSDGSGCEAPISICTGGADLEPLDAGTPTDGGLVGACLNTNDAMVQELPEFETTYQQCALSCFSEPERNDCVASCVASGSGLSADCAQCHGDYFDCLATSCFEDCVVGDPNSQPCYDCVVSAGCATNYDVCSGQ